MARHCGEHSLDESVIVVPDDKVMSVDSFCVPLYYQPMIDGIILSRGQIRDRLEKIALDVYQHYREFQEDIVLVVTMKGAITMFHELSQALRRISHTDLCEAHKRPCYVEQYVVCSSYHRTVQGNLKVHADVAQTIEKCRGKHVIIVEDLIDSGATLRRLTEDFKAAMKNADVQLDTVVGSATDPDRQNYVLSVRSIVGFAKRTDGDWGGFIPDWIGFSVPDVWIVGFGCDVSNHFRDLDHLAIISELGKKHYENLADQN